MIKRLLACVAVWSAVAAGAAETKYFAIASAGDVDFELAQKVRGYLEKQTGVALRFADPVPAKEGQGLDAIGRAAAAKLKPDELGIVVLSMPGAGQPQGVCLPHERFGILNLSRLGEGVDEEQLVRRAGQDGLRVMSMLLGMSPCPFHLCVLAPFEKTEDLDRMSGNFCPPCRDRFMRLAREAGAATVANVEADGGPQSVQAATDAE